ncbi:MAG: hypothetical protein HN576_08690 [Bacteriovoracaceae bacterium]|jgi:hypothetical protein|nr:hypothetical protein [Bacteriovoracaceae bacterium]
MNKFHTLFKMMDDAIFQLMDSLKNSSVSVQYNQLIQQFSPKVQKVINQSINLTLFIIPILFIIFMSLSNMSLRSKVNTKIEILELNNTYTQKKQEVNTQRELVVSPRKFKNKLDLENNFKKTYARSGIDITQMTILNFRQNTKLKPLLKTEASIKFTSLTMNSLSSFLLALLKNYKMKIAAIDINLEEIDSTLSGDLSLIHYSKPNQ